MNTRLETCISTHIIVVDDNQYNRSILANLGYVYTSVPKINKSIALGYESTNNNKRIAKAVQLSKGMNKLHIFANSTSRSRKDICDNLDSNGIYWVAKPLSKVCFASDYEDEESVNYPTLKKVHTNILSMYTDAWNNTSSESKNSIDILTEANIDFSPEHPVHFTVRNSISSRYNGANTLIEITQNTNGVMTDLMSTNTIAEKVGIKMSTANEIGCGTILPFTLPLILMELFGNELKFKSKRDSINKFLDGSFELHFVSEDNERYEEMFCFEDTLNIELRRWFNDPAMTFEKFIKHTSMFMMPTDEDAFSS